jgi:hypothetical protein
MAYTDKASIENYLLTEINVSFNDQIAEWIAAVTKYIENQTGRVFELIQSEENPAQPEARLFEGGNRQTLLIDDLIGGEGLGVLIVEKGDRYGENFTVIDEADYQTLPLNSGTNASGPITSIGLKRQAWGVGIHRITGYWGYSVIPPADVKFAATVLTAGIVTAHFSNESITKSETIGNYSVSYTTPTQAADFERIPAILDSYRRITI